MWQYYFNLGSERAHNAPAHWHAAARCLRLDTPTAALSHAFRAGSPGSAGSTWRRWRRAPPDVGRLVAGGEELAPAGAGLRLLLLDPCAELDEHHHVVLGAVDAGVDLLELGLGVAVGGGLQGSEAVVCDLAAAGLPLVEGHLTVVARLVVDVTAAAVDECEGVVHDRVQADVRGEAAELALVAVVVLGGLGRELALLAQVLGVVEGADVRRAEALPHADGLLLVGGKRRDERLLDPAVHLGERRLPVTVGVHGAPALRAHGLAGGVLARHQAEDFDEFLACGRDAELLCLRGCCCPHCVWLWLAEKKEKLVV